MNSNEEIIQAYIAQKERLKQIQIMQLRNNLKTFILKELKKEIIEMKPDKFAVTRTKREQTIELIIAYHFLFPHLLTKQGSKSRAKPVTKKQPTNL